MWIKQSARLEALFYIKDLLEKQGVSFDRVNSPYYITGWKHLLDNFEHCLFHGIYDKLTQQHKKTIVRILEKYHINFEICDDHDVIKLEE